jgi:hypothetical protein
VTMQPLQSSSLRSVGFEGNRLRVEFKNGGVYEFDDIDEATFNAMMEAPSPGAFFAANIRNRSFTKVS